MVTAFDSTPVQQNLEQERPALSAQNSKCLPLGYSHSYASLNHKVPPVPETLSQNPINAGLSLILAGLVAPFAELLEKHNPSRPGSPGTRTPRCPNVERLRFGPPKRPKFQTLTMYSAALTKWAHQLVHFDAHGKERPYMSATCMVEQA
jgi:hypothetical protein